MSIFLSVLSVFLFEFLKLYLLIIGQLRFKELSVLFVFDILTLKISLAEFVLDLFILFFFSKNILHALRFLKHECLF